MYRSKNDTIFFCKENVTDPHEPVLHCGILEVWLCSTETECEMGDPMQTASAAEQLFSVGGFSSAEHISSGAPELFNKYWHSTTRTDTPWNEIINNTSFFKQKKQYHAASNGTGSPIVWNPGSTRMNGTFLDANWSRIRTMGLVHFPTGHHVITNDGAHPITAIASRRTL